MPNGTYGGVRGARDYPLLDLDIGKDFTKKKLPQTKSPPSGLKVEIVFIFLKSVVVEQWLGLELQK